MNKNSVAIELENKQQKLQAFNSASIVVSIVHKLKEICSRIYFLAAVVYWLVYWLIRCKLVAQIPTKIPQTKRNMKKYFFGNILLIVFWQKL